MYMYMYYDCFALLCIRNPMPETEDHNQSDYLEIDPPMGSASRPFNLRRIPIRDFRDSYSGVCLFSSHYMSLRYQPVPVRPVSEACPQIGGTMHLNLLERDGRGVGSAFVLLVPGWYGVGSISCQEVKPWNTRAPKQAYFQEPLHRTPETVRHTFAYEICTNPTGKFYRHRCMEASTYEGAAKKLRNM